MQQPQTKFFKQAGINMSQYFGNVGLFSACPQCGTNFNYNNYANLLNCNHFLCQDCCSLVNNVKTCKFPGCKAQIYIKKSKFWPLEQKNKLNGNYYNFVIYVGYGATKGTYYKDISQNTTIKELLQMDYNAQQYLKLLHPQHQSVVMGGMNKLFDKIKYLKIKDLITEAGIRSNATNKIVFESRQKGGQM